MKESLIEKYTPEIWNVYLKQVKETMKDGVLSTKYKELIALALPRQVFPYNWHL